MSLTKQNVFDAQDLRRERVDVPEWAPPNTDPKDAYVWVRTMRADERAALVKWVNQEGRTHADAAPYVVALTCVDDEGARLFTEADAVALAAKSWAVVDRIHTAGWRVNALGDKQIEELEKNSEATASASSALNSPVT